MTTIEPIRRTKRPEHVHRASQPCLSEKYEFTTYAAAKKWAKRMNLHHRGDGRVFYPIPYRGVFAIGTRSRFPEASEL